MSHYCPMGPRKQIRKVTLQMDGKRVVVGPTPVNLTGCEDPMLAAFEESGRLVRVGGPGVKPEPFKQKKGPRPLKPAAEPVELEAEDSGSGKSKRGKGKGK